MPVSWICILDLNSPFASSCFSKVLLCYTSILSVSFISTRSHRSGTRYSNPHCAFGGIQAFYAQVHQSVAEPEACNHHNKPNRRRTRIGRERQATLLPGIDIHYLYQCYPAESTTSQATDMSTLLSSSTPDCGRCSLVPPSFWPCEYGSRSRVATDCGGTITFSSRLG